MLCRNIRLVLFIFISNGLCSSDEICCFNKIFNGVYNKTFYEVGIEKYQYVAALSERTCDICGPLDGQVFKTADIQEGVNYPTMHPRCRCTTTIVMDYNTRSARNPITGKSEYIDGDVTYNEWRKNMSPQEKQAFDLKQLKIKNKSSDKKQYEQYKEVLGVKNVGRSFDKWQEMKYNKTEENVKRYDELKGFFEYKNKYNSAELEHYRIYRDLKSSGINIGIALPANNMPAYILKDENTSRDAYHIMRRMKERNITDDEVRSYKDNAKVMFSQWGGQRRVYYSDMGVSVITKNSEQWVFKTVWRKEDFDNTTEKILEVVNKYAK